MSNLKVNSIQLGKSSDPTKNITLKVPTVPDGTLEIRRGNAEAPGALVGKVDAQGRLLGVVPAFAARSSAGKVIGTGEVTAVVCDVVVHEVGIEVGYGWDGGATFFAPVSGVYSFDLFVSFSVAGGTINLGEAYLRDKTSAQVSFGIYLYPLDGAAITSCSHLEIYMAKGDWVSAVARTNHTGTATMTGMRCCGHLISADL